MVRKFITGMAALALVLTLIGCNTDGDSSGNESTITVTYNINNGTGTAPAKQTVKPGEKVTLHGDNGFSRDGFAFNGWNTEDSGDGTTYAAGYNFTPIGNITLFAKWVESGSFNEVDFMEMVLIKAGTYTRGSTHDYDGATPIHEVTLTKDFWMGIYPVTQEQFTTVMGFNPSQYKTFKGEPCFRWPVESVSWLSAIAFCNRLSVMEELTPVYRMNGSTNPSDWIEPPLEPCDEWDAIEVLADATGYRLPTEAQWEYACKAGTTTAYNTGETITTSQANFDWDMGRTSIVGSYEPNAWGLYDMHGNVWEWCWDGWDGYSSELHQIDPTGPSEGRYRRVRRGGSWSNDDIYLRSTLRQSDMPLFWEWDAGRRPDSGFRVVRP